MNFRAILGMKCPRCHAGPVFAGALRTHETCPHCGLQYEREPGFFLGAMYFSYGLGILAALPVVLWLFFSGASELVTAASGTAVIVVLCPILLRYSKVLWLHFDQKWDPR